MGPVVSVEVSEAPADIVLVVKMDSAKMDTRARVVRLQESTFDWDDDTCNYGSRL